MISILIPTYDYSALPLAETLHLQCSQLGIPFEILCRDDASGSPINAENNRINELPNSSFSANETNLGRGKNINAMAADARHDWLILLDCDIWPTTENFIENYLAIIKSTDCNAAYGGIIYKDEKPKNEEMLRWIYGRKRESIPLEQRKNDPYGTTLTSNLAIRKDIFLQHLFHEDITEYGCEDIVFRHNLRESGVAIAQIDNLAYHLNLETSQTFLNKTKISLQNLSNLHESGLITASESQLIRAFTKLKSWKLDSMMAKLFKHWAKPAERNLLSKKPSLFVFDMYRLGYFCSTKSR